MCVSIPGVRAHREHTADTLLERRVVRRAGGQTTRKLRRDYARCLQTPTFEVPPHYRRGTAAGAKESSCAGPVHAATRGGGMPSSCLQPAPGWPAAAFAHTSDTLSTHRARTTIRSARICISVRRVRVSLQYPFNAPAKTKIRRTLASSETIVPLELQAPVQCYKLLRALAAPESPLVSLLA